MLRNLLVGALVAGSLIALPASADAAAPRGALLESEYQTLVAYADQAAAVGEDPTAAQVRAVCAAIAGRATGLIAASHRLCLSTARVYETGVAMNAVQQTCAADVGCFARALLRFEQATRAVARHGRAERRVVAERGLTGSCARAFTSRASIRALEDAARAIGAMRRAMVRGDEEGVERAGRQMDRVSEPDDESSAKSAQRLRTCPRA